MGDSPTPPEQPKKWGFTKKPAWVKNNVKPESKATARDGASLFSRSTDSHKDIVAEQERRKKLKLEKRTKVAEEEASSKSKRRRISTEEEDAEAAISPRRKSRTPSLQDLRETSSPSSLSKRYNAAGSAATKPTKEAIVIDLGDSSDEDATMPKSNLSEPPKKQPKPVNDGHIEDPDEAFPELAAKARERARQRKLEQEAKERDSFQSNYQQEDPILQVLVSSKIPGTAPLLVRRKYTQNLRDIRIAWCQRQNFDERQTQDIFFTYRGHRVFDVATCKSLGIDLNEDNLPIIRGNKDNTEDGDKLVLWATTQAIVDEEKRAAESAAEAARKREEEEAEGLVPIPEQPKGIKILMKGKGYEPYKLMVRPHTTFEKIAGAFRKERNVPADKEILLNFDGEFLDPESTMAESEIEDMDSIEVHIK